MSNTDQKLFLYKPAFADLDMRQALLADPETMSYNKAYGGTIDWPETEWRQWYSRWVAQDREQCFYRYLMTADKEFVGEVAYQLDPKLGGYMTDIIISAKHRGHGYGKTGLNLLCGAAKARGIKVLYDNIALDNPSINLFLAAGFIEVIRTTESILLKKEL